MENVLIKGVSYTADQAKAILAIKKPVKVAEPLKVVKKSDKDDKNSKSDD